MDFFEHQDVARRKTARLVVYFVVAVILIVLSVNLAVAALLNASGYLSGEYNPLQPGFTMLPEQVERLPPPVRWWRPQLYGYVSFGTLLVIFAGSAHKIASLSQGGAAVASLLGGRPLMSQTHEADERKLLNVVEEMSIASGVPMPAVYVMDREKGINAFAAGFGTSDAVIGVTRGAIEKLSRDELQGVIAHEFSHILNGDMRLNLRLIGLLHGILVIGLIGYGLLRHSPRVIGDSDSKGSVFAVFAAMLLGLTIMTIGYAGLFFGRLIQAAVSRQREFLADASAVQFTRNPDGIAGALLKILRSAGGARMNSAHAPEASHLFFGNALGHAWIGLLATHPPLETRIRAIDPTFIERAPSPVTEVTEAAPRGEGISQVVGALHPGEVVARVGRPQARQVAYAGMMLNDLPAQVRSAAHEPYGARALVLCLLLQADPVTRQRQIQPLQQSSDAGLFEEMLRLAPIVGDLPPAARLPLIDISLAALRAMSPQQMRAFFKQVRELIAADRQVSLFEFSLYRILVRSLAPARPPTVKYFALKPMLEHVAVLLSALARAGDKNDSQAAAAYAGGVAALQDGAEYADPRVIETPAAQAIDAALDQLAMASPGVKRRIIAACAAAVSADQTIQPEEAELLRAVAATLDCPIPPLLAAA